MAGSAHKKRQRQGMKCIKLYMHGSWIYRRVRTKLADELVLREGWEYCPKSEWDINK